MLQRRGRRIICLVIIIIVSILWLCCGNNSIEVTKIEVADELIPEEFNGIVIVQVSDLHNSI